MNNEETINYEVLKKNLRNFFKLDHFRNSVQKDAVKTILNREYISRNSDVRKARSSRILLRKNVMVQTVRVNKCFVYFLLLLYLKFNYNLLCALSSSVFQPILNRLCLQTRDVSISCCYFLKLIC